MSRVVQKGPERRSGHIRTLRLRLDTENNLISPECTDSQILLS